MSKAYSMIWLVVCGVASTSSSAFAQATPHDFMPPDMMITHGVPSGPGAFEPPMEAATQDAQAPTPPPPLPEKLTTLFFTPSERQLLVQAKLFYGRQGLGDDDIYDEEDLLDQLNNVRLKAQGKKVEPEIRELYYAQFYLESIIYHSPQDWKIRVKEDAQSKEFAAHAQGGNDASLKVISISREQVTFEWEPIDWQRIVDTYKQPSAAIYLDNEGQKVIFSLMVNQTLFSYDMTLREGVMNLVQNLQAVQDAANSADPLSPSNLLPELLSDDKLPPAPGAAVDPSSKQGLPGLIGAYQKLEKQEGKP